MDFNATIDLIIKDLDEARDIIDDLKKYPEVPVLQVELAKSKCKSAGELIALLKNLRETFISENHKETQVKTLTQLTEEKAETIKAVEPTLPVEDINKEPAPVEVYSPPVKKKEVPRKIREKEAESAIIADKFSHLSNRFNEQLGNLKSDDDVKDILKTKPLTSLTEAIGVNDKFLFIREIFDGNKDAYAQAIVRLDNAENLKDAKAVIMSYTGDNNENEAVKQLIDLVKRKLPSNE
jgi:hypothetical protein